MIKCNSNPLRKELTALQIAAVSYLSKKKVDTEIIGVPDHQRYGTSKERFASHWTGANAFIFTHKGVEYNITIDAREFSEW